ncbi:ac55-like protein [Clanis bilineata nucleopolyhedrovirus]|uniref:Ac55-like protein n=1 Tax=Clanis bilineata nucleopolyhedrovirus TaxID=1307957 RepID=Q0N459_9ABAC|nr:ac55-like protein [Clanis bilineata nucleopolyhedrovirus]ABF47384.1 ac55-like protein [Clanis bilineata nucleopolyhedrovirus]
MSSNSSRQVDFKLGKVIDNTVDNKMKCYAANTQKNNSLASFYKQYEEDTGKVGRMTTYNVVGQRDYKKHLDDKRYKF